MLATTVSIGMAVYRIRFDHETDLSHDVIANVDEHEIIVGPNASATLIETVLRECHSREFPSSDDLQSSLRERQ
jgi:hypothetical protein